MPPTSPGSANYYLALNGAPNGPHSAGAVLELLQQGSIQPGTLICREGGAAWVPVSELETALREEAMPAPAMTPPPVVPPPVPAPAPSNYGPPGPQPGTSPSNYGPPDPLPGTSAAPVVAGYSGQSAPARQYRPAVSPPAAPAANSDGTKPLRFATLLGAVVLFFLPWLELRCATVKTMRQSGWEATVSSYSLDDQMSSVMDLGARSSGMPGRGQEAMDQIQSEKVRDEFTKKVGYAWFVGGALVCVVFGLLASLTPSGRQTSGVMALLALICLGMQALSGFPLQEKLTEQLKDAARSKPLTTDQDIAIRGVFGKEGIHDMMKCEYTPWFYTELGLLALATIIGFTGGNRK